MPTLKALPHKRQGRGKRSIVALPLLLHESEQNNNGRDNLSAASGAVN